MRRKKGGRIIMIADAEAWAMNYVEIDGVMVCPRVIVKVICRLGNRIRIANEHRKLKEYLAKRSPLLFDDEPRTFSKIQTGPGEP